LNQVPPDCPDAWGEDATAAADARGRLRAQFLLVIAAFVILWVFVEGVTLWSRFPERVPIHFGLHGKPDGWAAKSFLSVFGMLIVDAVMLAGMVFAASPRLSVRYYNFPGKERVLRLPPVQQAHVLAPLRESLAWLGAGVSIGLALLCRQAWAVALTRRETISPGVMLVPMAVGLAAVVLGIIHTRRRIGQLEQAS
jgi:hypothetical protein